MYRCLQVCNMQVDDREIDDYGRVKTSSGMVQWVGVEWWYY